MNEKEQRESAQNEGRGSVLIIIIGIVLSLFIPALVLWGFYTVLATDITVLPAISYGKMWVLTLLLSAAAGTIRGIFGISDSGRKK
jgi:hypothetical protein